MSPRRKPLFHLFNMPQTLYRICGFINSLCIFLSQANKEKFIKPKVGQKEYSKKANSVIPLCSPCPLWFYLFLTTVNGDTQRNFCKQTLSCLRLDKFTLCALFDLSGKKNTHFSLSQFLQIHFRLIKNKHIRHTEKFL